MRRLELPFTAVLTISFSVISMLLYLAASLIILGFQSRHSRADLHVLLYSEAEGLAGYVAATGRLDYPELASFEKQTPVPIWLRVIQGSEVVAATPELPAVPVPPAADGSLAIVRAESGELLASVQHAVWNRPDMRVEALTPQAILGRRRRMLLLTLLLTGLILVPLSAIAGHLLARYALRPLRSLVASIRATEPSRLNRRLRVSGAVREISDLAVEFNRLLERVENNVEHMQRFTANASHELRTPISSLRTSIEVTLRRERSPEEYRTLLAECLQEIDRLQRVVEGLMALAREQAAVDVETPRDAVDLTEEAELALRTLRPLAEARELRLTAGCQAGVVVRGNADQLRLLLINLIDNAFKHSPRGGEVRVDVCRAGGFARVTVADQGPGIPPEDRPFIFDRHYQSGGVRASRSLRIGGIGLDLVRWVVDVHRGKVRLVEGVETGAEFEVLLPLAEDGGDGPAAGVEGPGLAA